MNKYVGAQMSIDKRAFILRIQGDLNSEGYNVNKTDVLKSMVEEFQDSPEFLERLKDRIRKKKPVNNLKEKKEGKV